MPYGPSNYWGNASTKSVVTQHTSYKAKLDRKTTGFVVQNCSNTRYSVTGASV